MGLLPPRLAFLLQSLLLSLLVALVVSRVVHVCRGYR
jgi:hypothetical protein